MEYNHNKKDVESYDTERGVIESKGYSSNLHFQRSIISSGADYAEMFETWDGKSIDVGYFVTFHNQDKIRIATANDNYILGIISSNPSLIANAPDLIWCDKYLRDEWGRIKYNNLRPIINKECKGNIEYKSRLAKEGWVVVGLLGQILVRDDGGCKENEYCSCGDGGIAIPSENGYKVLKRTGENQILVLLNGSDSLRVVDKLEKRIEENENTIRLLKDEIEKMKQEKIYLLQEKNSLNNESDSKGEEYVE